MMNLTQTKIVGLTMELDLKAREYKKMCDKLEQLKQSNIIPNDDSLLELKQQFKKNYDEIVEINAQIKELKEKEDYIEKQTQEKYNPENMFRQKNNTDKDNEEEEISRLVIKNKKSIFLRLIEKIKNFFNRTNQ